MKKTVIGVVLLILIVLSIPVNVLAQARGKAPTKAGRLLIGTQLGLAAGTADDTVFALSFNADYHLDEDFSVGPLLQFGIGGDLFQMGISGQARYVFQNPRFPEVRPHLQGGLGFLFVDADIVNPSPPPGRVNRDDLGFLVPFGGGVDFQLDKNVLLGTTLLLNFTDADVGQDNLFMTWFFGFRFLL